MDKVFFLVQGSAAEPYEVVFKLRDDNNLSAYCTCQAGQKVPTANTDSTFSEAKPGELLKVIRTM